MSIRLYLLDSDPIQMPVGTTAWDIAKKFFPNKKSFAVGAFINKARELSDIRTVLKSGDHVELIFIPSPEALEVIRHSCAHVMAQAVQALWPEVKVAIGPVIKDGFYYDFDSPFSFRPEDLEKIEARMKEILAQKWEVKKEVWSKEQAIDTFKRQGEHYKLQIIEEIPEKEISIYKQGDWFDLCKGPHVKDLSQIGAVRVLSQSSAYWKGDESQARLQRIYGTAFHTEKDLKQFLRNRALAEQRDHRKLGKDMGLFYFSDLSTGSPFFTGKGAVIYNELQKFLRELYLEYGYEEVITPQLFNSALFSQSGHLSHFADNIYSVLDKPAKSLDKENTLSFLKPMNCPSHCVLYSFQKKSYKDLPWKVADFGRLHRREKKGVLHGLTRVNSMCQDDAHVFCSPDQLEREIEEILNMFKRVYTKLALNQYKIALSTRPENFMGGLDIWNKAEAILAKVLKKSHIPFEIQVGGGAFYGPKLDFLFVDAMDRQWQLGTLQCDFNMPRAFDLKYVDKDNTEKTPILLHRAVLGSLERFIGLYLEHTGGYIPLWMSPVQVLLINISESQEEYVRRCSRSLKDRGIRVEMDLRAEKLGYKIRSARLSKIPCMGIIGGKEMETESISLRLLGKEAGSLKINEFISKIEKRIKDRDNQLLL